MSEAPLAYNQGAFGNNETRSAGGTLNVVFFHDIVGHGLRGTVSRERGHAYRDLKHTSLSKTQILDQFCLRL
jgi:hypothetical protein